jgi:hypothetical protein
MLTQKDRSVLIHVPRRAGSWKARRSGILSHCMEAAVLLSILSTASAQLQAQTYGCNTAGDQFCSTLNPVQIPANATTYPIDGFMVFAPGASGSNQLTMPTYVNNGQGTGVNVNPNPFSLSPFPTPYNFYAASGKILAPGPHPSGPGYPEDVVYAWRHGNNVEVDFADPVKNAQYGRFQLNPAVGGVNQLIAPSMDKTTYGGNGSDHIAIAVGDLDGAVDANGETNDEIVVAFPALDIPTGVWVPQIYVLSYRNSTGAPSVYENDTHANLCALPCFTTQASFSANPSNTNQGTIFASGSIFSVAIGDFDGDGRNEIALATLQGYTNDVMISIFRFRTPLDYPNGNSQGSNLTWVSNSFFTGEQLAGGASFVGSLSLAAGDFNNDGKDELALAYPLWNKDTTTKPGSSNKDSHNCVVYGSTPPSGNLGLLNATCDYDGWGVTFGYYLSLFQSGLTAANVTSIASAAFQPGTTTLYFPNANQFISGKVFISGAPGNWLGLNGVWDVIYADPTQLTIRLDSSQFGTPPGSGVTISTTTAFSQLGKTFGLNPRVDDPGHDYNKVNLPATFDFRDNDSRPVMLLQSGLFYMDPTNDASFHQRQLFAVWNTPTPAPNGGIPGETFSPLPWWPYDLVAGYFTVSSDGDNTISLPGFSQLVESKTWGNDGSGNNKYSYTRQRLSLTSSNFFGATDFDSSDPSKNQIPTWQWVIGGLTDHAGYHVRLGQINSDNKTISVTQDTWLPNDISASDIQTSGGSLPVVAYDPDGSSYYLGAPVLFQTTSFTQPSFIMQEPPGHIAWLNGSLTNLSRHSASSSSVTVDTSSGKNSSSTSTHGYDIANSASVSAEESLKVGSKMLGASSSIGDTFKLGYERKAIQSKTNTNNTTINTSSTNSTNSDDFIQYTSPSISIWRYRIYGAQSTDSNNPNEFYEIAVPGKPQTQGGGGINDDYYQPTHENGNILSYPPPYLNGNPPDVSATPYTVNGQAPPGLSNGIMSVPSAFCLGNAKQGGSLTITGATTTSDQVDTSNTMSESNELKAGGSVTAGGSSSSLNFDWTFGSNQSWGKSNVTGSTLQNSTNLAYNIAAGRDDYPYNVNPLLYYAVNGAIKMAYAVNIPSSINTVEGCGPGANWTNAYALADPGLVLPFRIEWTGSDANGDVYQLNSTVQREELKSFFVQSPTLDPVDKLYPTLTTNPNPGDTVRLALAVYNYSVGTSADNITVNFSPIPMSSKSDPDGGDNSEQACSPAHAGWVCPNSDRTQMVNDNGQVVRIENLSIPAWNSDVNNPNWTMATVNWTIPKTLATGKYRIYVTLGYTGTETNPPQAACTAASDSNTGCPTLCGDSALSCATPSLPDSKAPGQNNEGWAYITIGGGTATGLTATPGTATPAADVRTTNDSLVALGRNRLWKHLAVGYQGQVLQLRVRTIANLPEPRHHAVVVSEQATPRKGNQPVQIAQKMLQGTGPDGATAHFRWIPRSIGVHQLNAAVNEFADDAQKDNNTAKLKVIVLRTPGDVDGSGFVDAADLRVIEQEDGKLVLASSCGYACDLNGDGRIDRRDLEIAGIICGPRSCAASNGKPVPPKPIDYDALQDVNETELKMLRQLKSDDWEQLFRETEEQLLGRAQLGYLKALRRLAASTPSRPRKGSERASN